MENEQEILDVLKALGLRLTRSRIALGRLFSTSVTPLSVPEMLRQLSRQGIRVNKTTVYREVERFARLGIVGSVRLDDRLLRYELSHRAHHHHIVCTACERIEEVEFDEQSLLLAERCVGRLSGFSALRHSLEFFGLCARCQTIR